MIISPRSLIAQFTLALVFLFSAHAGEISLPSADATFSTAKQNSIELGQLLFYDPILSGNKSVACATCHHPDFGTSDGVPLAIGDGGMGLGPKREIDPQNVPEQRIGRNAPALFNLGAAQFISLFHDGRLETDPSRPSGIRSPLEDEMVLGFTSVLSAQAMFPVLSPDEMAGHYSENEISKAVRLGQLTIEGGAWDLIAQRVAAIPSYREMFDGVIGPDVAIEFTDISNAIADFIVFEWRADNSAFDLFLREEGGLSEDATAGMNLFYGKANCVACHAGQFQTDHEFHAIAMVQIGPGKAERFESHNRDVGRMRVTGDDADAYAFRTPSLRNVVLTGPYGHAGAYGTLEAVIRHHLDPVKSLNTFDRNFLQLPNFPGAIDFAILDNPQELAAIAAANELEPQNLSDNEVNQLLAFLDTLTDPISQYGRLGVPDAVPSGLPVD